MESSRRPIRIAGCSGSASDRRHAMASLAHNWSLDPVDVITGDWMSEANMTARGAGKAEHAGPAYEPSFLESIEPALEDIAKHNIKIVVNAGASDTEALCHQVEKMVAEKNLSLKVAWISGDEVLSAIVKASADASTEFENAHTGDKLADWSFTPLYAQAYLGGMGIAAALAAGADIVLCGRVSDASPVIAAAVWWHQWRRTQLHHLANALLAGHLIECSTYVCGGNFCGFKDLEPRQWSNIGYPIAEIGSSGQVVITKQKGTGGQVSVDTCTSQFLYEIQGPWYFNSDVTAVLNDVSLEQLSTDRVALHGLKGDLPPPTTKVGITAKGGYQAEVHYFLVGLDIQAKAAMLEAQIRKLLAPHMSRFSLLAFTINGSSPDNPPNQNCATVDFRILAQAPDAEDLGPTRFARPCLDVIMETYPGGTPNLDLRTAFPKPIYEYYVTLLPQSAVNHKAHISRSEDIVIPLPPETKTWPKRQPSYPETANPIPVPLKAAGGTSDAAGGWAEFPAQKGRRSLREVVGPWGRTVRGPLGWVVHARSGDKGSDCNVGLWVRHVDEWDWLRTILSVRRMAELLGEEYTRNIDPLTGKGKDIERFEIPGLRAVHFLLHDHLDRGVSCTASYDALGKNVAEFLRARWVDLPMRFVDRGKL